MTAYRRRELFSPSQGHVSSRLPKVYELSLRSKALELGTTPSFLLRFLAAKGAEHYGIDLLSVLP